jgi:hypothetical protein
MARGMLKGVRYFRENREGAVAAMMDHLGIEREVAEGTYDLGREAFAQDGIIPEASLRLLIEAAEFASGQPSNVTPERLADFSIVRRVSAGLQP